MTRTHRLIATAALIAAIAAVSVPVLSGGSASAAHGRNIVQTAAAAGQFTTLVKLVKQAGLAGTLSGQGPFTVFAPTDAAFAKVPKATLTALLHNRSKLRAVLLFHVLKGKITAAMLVKHRAVKTLEGQRLKVRVQGQTVTVGGATVIQANVGASNGVIHVIDHVLIPH